MGTYFKQKGFQKSGLYLDGKRCGKMVSENDGFSIEF